MSVLRNSAWAASAAILLTASRFAVTAILVRRLSQDAFGQYAYGQWLVDISFLVCSLGATGAASRYMAEYRHDQVSLKAFVKLWWPFALGLPLLASGVVLFGLWLSGITLPSDALVMIAVWTMANGFWAMQTAALTGLQRFDLIFAANAISAAIMVVGALLLPLSEQDLAWPFGLMAVACAFGASIGLNVTNKLRQGAGLSCIPTPWRTIKGYSVNIWFSALVASLVWSRGEMPIVKSVLGDSAVALYAVALAIFGGAVQGVMLGVSAVSPHITSLWGMGRKDEAISLARDIMDIQVILSALGSLFIIFFGSQIISILFTDVYQEVGVTLSILCFGLISLVVSSQSQLLQLETNARFNRNSILLGLFVLLSLAYTLIPLYGLNGAAMTRSGVMVTIGFVTILFTIRNWGWRTVSMRNITVVLMVLSTSMILMRMFQGVTLFLNLLFFFLGGIILIYCIRDQNGKMIISEIYNRLRKANC